MPAAPTSPDHDLVETIDISAWFGLDPAARDAVVKAVDQQCRRVGFLRISGHSIAPALTEDMMSATSAFFDLPESEKQGYVLADKARNRGYASYESEALAYSLGVDAKPDVFEAFNCGVEVKDRAEPYYAAELHRMFADNVWPTRPPSIRSVWLRYFEACQALTLDLMRLFAVALDMPETYLVERSSRAPNVMRANNYQRRSEHPAPEPDQMRMGAHTDYGTCTLLLADPVPGLQIVGPDGAWHDVIPEPGLAAREPRRPARRMDQRPLAFDAAPGRAPSIVVGESRRRSIAFFHEADYDAVVKVMATCTDADNPPRYAPVTAGEHLMNKLMGPRTLSKSAADQTALGDRIQAVTR